MSIDSAEQFEQMKRIGAIVANCLEFIKAKTRVGMSTLELDALAAEYLQAEGAISAPKSTYRFPGSICISVEKEAAHGIPGDRILADGDLINVDVSAHLNGYYADNGESYIVGDIRKAGKIKTKLCSVVKKALNIALAQAKAEAKISSIGAAVERLAKQHKLTVIENLGGHGVGRSLHEAPEFIASFYNKQDQRILTENLVVAIEPFVSNGARWVEEAGDGWTLYHPKYYAAQKEHTIMVTKDRPFIFTQPTKAFA